MRCIVVINRSRRGPGVGPSTLALRQVPLFVDGERTRINPIYNTGQYNTGHCTARACRRAVMPSIGLTTAEKRKGSRYSIAERRVPELIPRFLAVSL